MRALILNRYGDPDVLTLGERPAPQPGPGEVLVRVHFSGVNPIDVGVRAGRVLPDEPDRFPMVLGWDGAGVVEALGAGVNDFDIGERVMAISKQPSSGVGLHAEFAVLPVEQVVTLPDGIRLEDAAVTPLAGITALNAVEALRLPAGRGVLVNNPAGAVGRFAVQIAEALGFRVTQSPEDKVDGAVDVVGGARAQESFAAVREGGAYATVIPEWWKPGGVYAAARGILPVVVENAPTRIDLQRLAAWLAEGTIAPEIEAVLPLAEGAEAHRRIEAPGLTRKFVLDHQA